MKVVQYINGIQHGYIIYRYDTFNSQIMSRQYSINGIIDGKYQSWYINGNTYEIYNYVGGILNGKFIRFFKDGRIMEYGQYVNGICVEHLLTLLRSYI